MLPTRHADRPPANPLAIRLATPTAALLLAACLAGCGNKGDLYLVEPEPGGAPAGALPGLEPSPGAGAAEGAGTETGDAAASRRPRPAAGAPR